jgi:hypothetical protein
MNIVVDVEADGPCPGLYSMVCFGAVCVEDHDRVFYAQTSPISTNYIKEALSVSGFTREEHVFFPDSLKAISDFGVWLEYIITLRNSKRVYFWSDNPAFDWQFINYYFHLHQLVNPFGYSARRIGDLYAGLTGKVFDSTSWKRKRKTKHTHHPVDDAKGNAEVLYDLLYNSETFTKHRKI